jgi:hypothetical protein
MAKRFLTHLDMSGNQLLNATFEKLATDPTTGNFEGRMYYNTADEVVRLYDGENWVGLGAIKSIQGTTNEVVVTTDAEEVVTISLPDTINADTTGNAATATALETARTISFGGDLSGSALFDGTQDITITGFIDTDASVDSIQNSDGNLDLSASVGAITIDLASSITANVTGDLTGNADTATTLATARNISLGGDLSGSASFDGGSDITITATVNADSVELGTDTTGDYVASVSASGDGISVTGTGEGAAVTIENTGVTAIAGTTNEIEVSASVGSVTVGLPDDVIVGNNLTVSNDLVVQGDLTVSGTTTTVNTEEINLADNIITLNSNATGSPTENAGIEINRGDDPTVTLRWNETTDVWEATTDGSTYNTILLSGDAAASDISDFDEAAQDAVGGMVADTATVDLTYTDGTPELKADVKLQASDSYLVSASGLALDLATLEAQLVTDSFTKKAAASVGNGANTSFAVIHNLNTRDVQVQVYDNSTFDTVEVDVVRTDANTVTVSFTSAPASNAYRVVVIG